LRPTPAVVYCYVPGRVGVVFVTLNRCRMSNTLRASSSNVANDDVKYDVSNYARPPTTTTFWTSTSRPPCQHWPPCNPGICIAAATTAAVCSSSPGYRSSRLLRSDPHILLSPVGADSPESGRLWDALESYDGRSSSPHRSRCLLHSSPAELTSIDLN